MNKDGTLEKHCLCSFLNQKAKNIRNHQIIMVEDTKGTKGHGMCWKYAFIRDEFTICDNSCLWGLSRYLIFSIEFPTAKILPHV